VLAKLSELLFVEAVRRYVDGLPEERTGWLAGLRDPYVARSLALFHGNIGRAWTVTSWGAKWACRARRWLSALPPGRAAPMQYLGNWRMQVAAHDLRNTSASLARWPGGSAMTQRLLSPRVQEGIRRRARDLAPARHHDRRGRR